MPNDVRAACGVREIEIVRSHIREKVGEGACRQLTSLLEGVRSPH